LIKIEVSYSYAEKIQYVMEQMGIFIQEITYTDKVIIMSVVRDEEMEVFTKKIYRDNQR
jgi:putative IMPACT (imprinted ancient) family translation regulator